MKKVLLVVGIIAVLVAAGFVTYRVLAARQSAAQAGAANLQTTTVVRGSIPATISTAGTVRSGQTAVIAWTCPPAANTSWMARIWLSRTITI